MAEIIRHRTGNISRRVVNGNPYWVARIQVDKVRMRKSSKHRAAVEAWLAPLVEAHPTYVFRTNKAKALETWAARGRRWPRWAVAALGGGRRDRPADRRIPPPREARLAEIREGHRHRLHQRRAHSLGRGRQRGRGLHPPQAEAVAAGMPRDCGILYTARPMAGIRLIRRWDR